MADISHSSLTGGDLHVPQAHASSHVGSDQIQSATAGQRGLATSAQIAKLDGIETLADVTDPANVDLAGAVMETDYGAQTLMIATVDDTPVATTISEARVIGRATGGDLGELVGSEVRTIANVADGADVTGDNAPQAHAASHVGADSIQDATSSQKGLATTVQIAKLDNIEALADVTDATNVDSAGAVMESDYGVQTVLGAVTDNTPSAITVAEANFVGRPTAGDVSSLTAAQARTIINVSDGADVTETALTEEIACGKIGRDMSTFEMVHAVMSHLSTPRLLWSMECDPTAACADWSGKGHTGTYNGTWVAGDRKDVGRVHTLDFTSNYNSISVVDHADFTFGDGSADTAVSFAAVIEVTGTDTATILSKHNTTEAEYDFDLNAGYLRMRFHDESATAYIEMETDAVLSVGKHLVVATYDATEAHSGVTLYVDGEAAAATGALSGTYTAMENLAPSFRVGANGGNYFANEIGFVFVEAAEMTAANIWLLWLVVKAYYDL